MPLSLKLLALASTGLVATSITTSVAFTPICQDKMYAPCGHSYQHHEMNCCDVGYCQPWNSNYYQCIEKPDQCPNQETDIDYYGNDIKAIRDLQPHQCCDECANTENCKAYTFVNQNFDGKTACYLKTSADGRVVRMGAVSAKVEETTTPPPPSNCPEQEVDVDYYGHDIKMISDITQTECCDECGETDDCMAYTYVPKAWDNKPKCYLKKSTAGKTAKKGVVSGKRKDIPTPENCPIKELDTDYYGNDIKNVRGVTYDGCCKACGETSGCKAFTYVPVNPDGKSACYLKTSAAGKKKKAGAISGQYKCPKVVYSQCGSSYTGASCCPAATYCQRWSPAFYQCMPLPNASKCPKMESGVDYYGGDLEVKHNLLPGQCCDACVQNQDCKVFTYVSHNPDSKTACYLKSKIVEKRDHPLAVSGTTA